jgi:hypothetical protein
MEIRIELWFLLEQIIIAILFSMAVGKFHETIHLITAKLLGYKVKYFKLWRNETDVDIQDTDPNWKKIARAPYYVMFPLGVVLIIVGWYYSLGLFVAGIGTIIMHLVTFNLEGKDGK